MNASRTVDHQPSPWAGRGVRRSPRRPGHDRDAVEGDRRHHHRGHQVSRGVACDVCPTSGLESPSTGRAAAPAWLRPRSMLRRACRRASRPGPNLDRCAGRMTQQGPRSLPEAKPLIDGTATACEPFSRRSRGPMPRCAPRPVSGRPCRAAYGGALGPPTGGTLGRLAPVGMGPPSVAAVPSDTRHPGHGTGLDYCAAELVPLEVGPRLRVEMSPEYQYCVRRWCSLVSEH